MAETDVWGQLEPALVRANGGRPLPKPNGEGWIGSIRSPLRDDKHPSFSVVLPKEDDPGGWVDHGTGETGTLPELARRLGLVVEERSRRSFLGARALPESAARRFRIEQTYCDGRPALRYPTIVGVDRVKFLDGGKPKYRWAGRGGRGHWYGLQGAGKGDTLYIVNGEPSVWACQSRGIAAVAPLTGEGTPPSAEMVAELKQLMWAWERVRVVYDRDPAGEEGARRTVLALREAGIEAVALALPAWLGEKADVDLLHRATGARLGEELEALPELPLLAPVPEVAKPVAPRKPVVSIAELVGEPEEDVRYIVDGLLPSGATSLLCGKPKVGKSTLARSIALAVARGEPVLGRQTTRTPVLYLVLEEKRAEVARWFRTAGVTDEPLWVFIGTEVEDPLAFFAAEARQRGVGLVIVDPLHAMLRSGDINDYSRVNEAIKPLVEVARTGLHLLFVHHMGKGERSGGDRVLGSTALFGAVDALITMAREQGVFVVESIQRYGTDLEPTAIARDETTGLVRAVGPVEEVKDRPIRQAILEYLGEGEQTEEEIRTAVGGNQGAVGRALRQLLQTRDPRCALTRSGAGRKGDPFLYRRVGVRSPMRDGIQKGAHTQTGNKNTKAAGAQTVTSDEST